MKEITPLLLERCHHLILIDPNSEETAQLTYQILQTLLSLKNSPYILSVFTSKLLTYLTENSYNNQHLFSSNDISNLKSKYENNINNLIRFYCVDNIRDISQDFITYFYDKLIGELSFNKDLTNLDDKIKIYKDVCHLICERDIALWSITGKLQFIQGDIVGSLYSIDPDLLVFHNENKLKHLRDILAYKWCDNMTINQWQYILDKCNSILQSIDFDSSMNKSDILIGNKDNDKNVNNSIGKEDTLSEIESKSYWEINWWLLFAMFLTGNYNDVMIKFKELITTEKYIPKILGNSIEGLENLDNTVIDRKSILRIVIICAILTQNNKERDLIWGNPLLINTFFEDPLIKQFKENYESINFPKVKDILTELSNKISWCRQLEDTFEKLESLLFQKSITSYLSFVNRITLDQISLKFAVDKSIIKDYLIRSISILNLPLFFDNKTEIVEYRYDIDKFEISLTKDAHNNIDEEILRIKAKKLNNILGQEINTGGK